jgi:E3 ubiquitin-protein ligase NEDD4
LNREHDITGIIDKTFTTTEEHSGQIVTVELKPGGIDTPVTEGNKKDYVDLATNYRISKRIGEQLDAFTSGFSELIPQDLITLFNEQEFEQLVRGLFQP